MSTPAKRKSTEKLILQIIKDGTFNDKFNVSLYENLFKRMTNTDFHKMMLSLKNGGYLHIIVTPGSDLEKKYNTNKLISLLKSYGIDPYQTLKFKEDGIEAETDIKHLVTVIPNRRFIQTLETGLSVPKSSLGRVNHLTDQVTGDYQASKLSKPEAEILDKHYGLKYTLNEFIRYRGGDLSAMQALNQLASNHGEISQETIENYSTIRKSTKSVKMFFAGAHYKLK